MNQPLREDFSLLSAPAAVPGGIPAWVWASGGMVLLGVVVWVFFLRRRTRLKKKAAASSQESAESVALRELRQWQTWRGAERQRDAIAGIAATMRRFAEAKYGAGVTAMTSEEFWVRQAGGAWLPDEHQSFWREFFLTCDSVVYAGTRLNPVQFDTAVDSAIALVGGEHQADEAQATTEATRGSLGETVDNHE